MCNPATGAFPRARRLIVMAVVLGAGASPAAAGPYLGVKWPTHAVRYFDATHQKVAVTQAAARWNASGVNFRLVRTTNRSQASVIVSDRAGKIGQCGAGLTQMRSSNGRMTHADVFIFGGRCRRQAQVFTVAHEFGHVLGLDHEPSVCSVMNPSGNAQGGSRCPRAPSAAYWRCRVLEVVDVRRAVRLYGGTVRPVRRNPFCRLS